jgi:hypothetical protein
MTLELSFGARSLTALAIASLTIAIARDAGAATYTETITDNPSNFTCTTASDVKTCYGYAFLFAPPPKGTGTLVSGSGVFYANASDTVDIDLNYTTPLYVPMGAGPTIPGKRPYDIAFDVLYDWNGSQLVITNESSSTLSTVTGYVGPPGLMLSETYTNIGGFVGFGAPDSNPAAFSITGIDSTITVLASDPYPMYEVAYGYETTVPEPASWVALLIGLGVVGAAIRTRRRHPPLMVADRTTCHVT